MHGTGPYNWEVILNGSLQKSSSVVFQGQKGFGFEASSIRLCFWTFFLQILQCE